MKRTIQITVGFLAGAALLYFLFKGTNWEEVSASIRRAHVGWLLMSLVFIIGSFFTRIQRWSYIVRVAKPVSFRHMFSATQIGFLVNFIVPARLGEVVRALALTRLTRIPFTKSLAMVGLDRVTDFVGLIVVMGIAVAGFPITSDIVIPKDTLNNTAPLVVPQALVRQGEVLTGVTLVALLAVLVMAYVSQSLVLRAARKTLGYVSQRLADKVCTLIRHFVEGLHIFRSAADMAKSIFWSLVTWAFFVAGTAALMQAFAIPWPWYTAFVLQSLLAICLVFPITPGLVGQYHLPIVAAIVATVPGTAPAEAKALALVAHLFNIIPVVIAGVYCLYREKLGLLELSTQGKREEEVLHGAETAIGADLSSEK